MKDFIIYAVGMVITLCVLYGVYWIGKTVSYSVFYKGMVESTVIEIVKPECRYHEDHNE